jgi:hypothetical protein
VALDGPLPQDARAGTHVTARIHCGPRSLGVTYEETNWGWGPRRSAKRRRGRGPAGIRFPRGGGSASDLHERRA